MGLINLTERNCVKIHFNTFGQQILNLSNNIIKFLFPEILNFTIWLTDAADAETSGTDAGTDATIHLAFDRSQAGAVVAGRTIAAGATESHDGE